MIVNVGTPGSTREHLMYRAQSQMAHILGGLLFHPTHTVAIIKCQTTGSDMAGEHARYNMLERNTAPKCIF